MTQPPVPPSNTLVIKLTPGSRGSGGGAGGEASMLLLLARSSNEGMHGAIVGCIYATHPRCTRAPRTATLATLALESVSMADL